MRFQHGERGTAVSFSTKSPYRLMTIISDVHLIVVTTQWSSINIEFIAIRLELKLSSSVENDSAGLRKWRKIVLGLKTFWKAIKLLINRLEFISGILFLSNLLRSSGLFFCFHFFTLSPRFPQRMTFLHHVSLCFSPHFKSTVRKFCYAKIFLPFLCHQLT